MILFFDTETTGLPKDFNAPASDTDNWPRLVQLSYIVSDFYGNQIYTCNEIIKPIDYTIPQASSDIHNITTGIAKNRGSLISDVFELFLIHVKRVDVIVAHNLAFDQKIISSELVRLGIDNPLELKKRICTMKISTDFCEIPGTKGYKWPRLEELHFKLFKSDFAGAHDAYVDAIATAKCFWELERLGLIDISKERSYWRINSLAKMLTAKNKLKTEDVSESNVTMKSIEEILKDAPDGFSTPLDDGLSDSQKFEPKIDDQLVNGVPCLLIGKGELKWAIYDIKNEKLVGGKEAGLSEVIGKINLDE